MTFLKIAWRNIARNKFRSLITITAVSFGLGALIFIRAFVVGGDCQMMENYTDLVSGHVQIHAKGFQKKMGLERSITDTGAVENCLKGTKDIRAFAKRIKDYVLLSSAEQSSGVLLVGVEPTAEAAVTTLNKHIRKGEFLSEGKKGQIVLGKDLLDILNVDLGDKIVIMGQGADGSLVSGAYRLCGVLDAGTEEMDRGIALITLADAQSLLVMDNKVSEFIIRADDVYKADGVYARIKKTLADPKLEILSWKEIAPMVVQWLEFDRAFIDIILFIVLLVVAAGILNTILIGVLERTREFGIMLALGTKRRQTVLMVILESFILGLIGVFIGNIFGIAVSVYFGKYGVNLSAFSNAFESYYVGSMIYPRLFIADLLGASVLVLVTSIVVSVYPAWRAAGLKPVEAIRHF